jgi:hypothetical protein
LVKATQSAILKASINKLFTKQTNKNIVHEGIILAFKNIHGTIESIGTHKYYSIEQHYYWKLDGSLDFQEIVNTSCANLIHSIQSHTLSLDN